MTEENQKEKKFGLIAEVEGYNRQLIMLNLPFGRLIDEIVVPYENDEAFFIDGVPITKSKIKRIKIVELTDKFRWEIGELERGMTHGDAKNKKTYGDQYHTRFEHILRTHTVDVTSQVIKAYNQIIKPRIKDYFPKRGELITTAAKVFIEGMKLLGG